MVREEVLLECLEGYNIVEQIGFDFSAKPGPEKGAVVETPKESPEEYLDIETLGKNRQAMVFLYGKNTHLCFVQFHDSKKAKDRPTMRKDAEGVLSKNGYYHHSNHRNGKRFAKVYRVRK